MNKNQIWCYLREYGAWMLLIWLVLYLIATRRGKAKVKISFLAVSGAVYWVTFLFVTLLSRTQRAEMRYELALFWELRKAFSFEFGHLSLQSREWFDDIVNNIILFIPMGVFLSELGSRRQTGKLFPWVMCWGFLASGFVEVSQLVFRLGLFETDDLLNNCIGTMLGFCWWAIASGRQFRNRSGNGSGG